MELLKNLFKLTIIAVWLFSLVLAFIGIGWVISFYILNQLFEAALPFLILLLDK